MLTEWIRYLRLNPWAWFPSEQEAGERRAKEFRETIKRWQEEQVNKPEESCDDRR